MIRDHKQTFTTQHSAPVWDAAKYAQRSALLHVSSEDATVSRGNLLADLHSTKGDPDYEVTFSDYDVFSTEPGVFSRAEFGDSSG